MGSLTGSWFFLFFKTLTAAGKAARRGEATIYRGIYTAADGFARREKPKTPAAVKVSVAVNAEHAHHTLMLSAPHAIYRVVSWLS